MIGDACHGHLLVPEEKRLPLMSAKTKRGDEAANENHH